MRFWAEQTAKNKDELKIFIFNLFAQEYSMDDL